MAPSSSNFVDYCFFFFIWAVSNLLVRFLIKTCTKSRAKIRNPPSPLALPIIGHLHLLSPSLPKSLQNLALRYGPLMQIRIGATSFIIASNAAVAREMLKTHDIDFASRFEFGPSNYNIYSGAGFVTGPNGSYWRFMKKLCMTKLFAGPQLDRFNHIREQEIENLLKSLLKSSGEGEACDLAAELTTLTNNLLCRMALSKRCSAYDATGANEIRKLVVEIMRLAAKIGVNDVFGPLRKFDLFGHGKRLVESLWRYDRFFEQIMKEYEDNMGDGGQGKEAADLMSIVLETYKDTNAEVKITRNQIKFFFIVST
jgi:cytochrome P450